MSTVVKANTVRNYQKGEVPKNLKKVRYDLGYSIYTLADKLGVSPSTVSYHENGVRFPRKKLLMEMEDFFGMGHRELFRDLTEEETYILEQRIEANPITATTARV